MEPIDVSFFKKICLVLKKESFFHPNLKSPQTLEPGEPNSYLLVYYLHYSSSTVGYHSYEYYCGLLLIARLQ